MIGDYATESIEQNPIQNDPFSLFIKKNEKRLRNELNVVQRNHSVRQNRRRAEFARNRFKISVKYVKNNRFMRDPRSNKIKLYDIQCKRILFNDEQDRRDRLMNRGIDPDSYFKYKKMMKQNKLLNKQKHFHNKRTSVNHTEPIGSNKRPATLFDTYALNGHPELSVQRLSNPLDSLDGLGYNFSRFYGSDYLELNEFAEFTAPARLEQVYADKMKTAAAEEFVKLRAYGSFGDLLPNSLQEIKCWIKNPPQIFIDWMAEKEKLDQAEKDEKKAHQSQIKDLKKLLEFAEQSTHKIIDNNNMSNVHSLEEEDTSKSTSHSSRSTAASAAICHWDEKEVILIGSNSQILDGHQKNLISEDAPSLSNTNDGTAIKEKSSLIEAQHLPQDNQMKLSVSHQCSCENKDRLLKPGESCQLCDEQKVLESSLLPYIFSSNNVSVSGAENNKFNLLNDYQSINQNSNSDHSPLISRFGEVSRRVSIVDDSEGKNASVPQTSTEIKKLTRRMSSNSTPNRRASNSVMQGTGRLSTASLANLISQPASPTKTTLSVDHESQKVLFKLAHGCVKPPWDSPAKSASRFAWDDSTGIGNVIDATLLTHYEEEKKVKDHIRSTPKWKRDYENMHLKVDHVKSLTETKNALANLIGKSEYEVSIAMDRRKLLGKYGGRLLNLKRCLLRPIFAEEMLPDAEVHHNNKKQSKLGEKSAKQSLNHLETNDRTTDLKDDAQGFHGDDQTNGDINASRRNFDANEEWLSPTDPNEGDDGLNSSTHRQSQKVSSIKEESKFVMRVSELLDKKKKKSHKDIQKALRVSSAMPPDHEVNTWFGPTFKMRPLYLPSCSEQTRLLLQKSTQERFIHRNAKLIERILDKVGDNNPHAAQLVHQLLDENPSRNQMLHEHQEQKKTEKNPLHIQIPDDRSGFEGLTPPIARTRRQSISVSRAVTPMDGFFTHNSLLHQYKESNKNKNNEVVQSHLNDLKPPIYIPVVSSSHSLAESIDPPKITVPTTTNQDFYSNSSKRNTPFNTNGFDNSRNKLTIEGTNEPAYDEALMFRSAREAKLSSVLQHASPELILKPIKVGTATRILSAAPRMESVGAPIVKSVLPIIPILNFKPLLEESNTAIQSQKLLDILDSEGSGSDHEEIDVMKLLDEDDDISRTSLMKSLDEPEIGSLFEPIGNQQARAHEYHHSTLDRNSSESFIDLHGHNNNNVSSNFSIEIGSDGEIHDRFIQQPTNDEGELSLDVINDDNQSDNTPYTNNNSNAGSVLRPLPHYIFSNLPEKQADKFAERKRHQAQLCGNSLPEITIAKNLSLGDLSLSPFDSTGDVQNSSILRKLDSAPQLMSNKKKESEPAKNACVPSRSDYFGQKKSLLPIKPIHACHKNLAPHPYALENLIAKRAAVKLKKERKFDAINISGILGECRAPEGRAKVVMSLKHASLLMKEAIIQSTTHSQNIILPSNQQEKHVENSSSISPIKGSEKELTTNLRNDDKEKSFNVFNQNEVLLHARQFCGVDANLRSESAPSLKDGFFHGLDKSKELSTVKRLNPKNESNNNICEDIIVENPFKKSSSQKLQPFNMNENDHHHQIVNGESTHKKLSKRQKIRKNNIKLLKSLSASSLTGHIQMTDFKISSKNNSKEVMDDDENNNDVFFKRIDTVSTRPPPVNYSLNFSTKMNGMINLSNINNGEAQATPSTTTNTFPYELVRLHTGVKRNNYVGALACESNFLKK